MSPEYAHDVDNDRINDAAYRTGAQNLEPM
jgi:hypothetical protein